MITLTEEQAVSLTFRARFPLALPQMVGEGGEKRGVILRALSVDDRAAAERAATVQVRQGVWEVDEWRRMCEEVARGIAEPAGLTAAVIGRWNTEVVRLIHERLNLTAYMAPATTDAILAAAQGAPPPAPRPRRGRGPADAGVGAGAGGASGRDAGQPG